MSSNRARLLLDEQSFQGLLAAAFTIQEHTDRKRKAATDAASSPPASPPPHESAATQPRLEPPAPTEESSLSPSLDAELCPRCGQPLNAPAAPCAACAPDDYRPGERLQRTWASMWMMSQEHGFAFDHGANAAASTKEDLSESGTVRVQSANSALAAPRPSPPLVSRQAHQAPDGEHSLNILPAEEFASAGPDVSGETQDELSGDALARAAAGSLFPWPEESSSAEAEPETLPVLAAAADSADSDASHTAAATIWDWRVKLRFHRADLYLGLAIFVAGVALLWPAAAAPQGPSRHPWEKMLIAMGIAEAPAPASHFRGDPSLKVWADPHTALYYCPGDDLYGKSPDGHYSTQREAQADRFEPAERSVCIQ